MRTEVPAIGPLPATGMATLRPLARSTATAYVSVLPSTPDWRLITTALPSTRNASVAFLADEGGAAGRSAVALGIRMRARAVAPAASTMRSLVYAGGPSFTGDGGPVTPKTRPVLSLDHARYAPPSSPERVKSVRG